MVVWCPDGAGLRGAAQHSQSLEAWFVHTPGLKVVVPSEPADVKGLIKAAIRDDDPVMFFQHKRLFRREGPVPQIRTSSIPLGQAAVKREGTDVTLLTYGSGYFLCREAVDDLTKLKIDAEVIDLRSLKPLDMPTVAASIKKTHRAVIVHEACLTGGFGAELTARIQSDVFDYLDAPVAGWRPKTCRSPLHRPWKILCCPRCPNSSRRCGPLHTDRIVLIVPRYLILKTSRRRYPDFAPAGRQPLLNIPFDRSYRFGRYRDRSRQSRPASTTDSENVGWMRMLWASSWTVASNCIARTNHRSYPSHWHR